MGVGTVKKVIALMGIIVLSFSLASCSNHTPKPLKTSAAPTYKTVDPPASWNKAALLPETKPKFAMESSDETMSMYSPTADREAAKKWVEGMSQQGWEKVVVVANKDEYSVTLRKNNHFANVNLIDSYRDAKTGKTSPVTSYTISNEIPELH
jgi:hypothetical protein